MVAPIKSLDDALSEIATLVKIPEDCRSDFRGVVRSAIDSAVPRVTKLTLFSDDSVTSQFRTVKRNARALLAHLKTMEKGRRADNALGVAGLSLRVAAMDRGLTIKHFINPLELLVEVAEAAEHMGIARSERSTAGRKKAGRKKGTPGNLGFDFFIHQLRMDAQAVRINLTIFKRTDGSFGGSLFKTVELLRAHLPRDFVPKAGLGRRLHRIVHGR